MAWLRIRELANRSLVRNAAFVFATDILRRLLGFAVIYVLVRAMSKDQFGEYQFVLSVFGMVAMFGLPGLNNAVMQSVARGFSGTFRASIAPSMFASAIGSLLLAIVALWKYFVGDFELAVAFLVAAIAFPLVHGLRRWQGYKSGTENFHFILINETLFGFLVSFAVIGAALAQPGSIVWPLVAMLLVLATQNVINTFRVLSRIASDEPNEAGSVGYGIRTTFYLAFNLVANHLDKVLIYAFFSPASVALYFLAEKVAELAKSVAQNIVAVLAPRFAKAETYSRKLDSVLRTLTFVLGVLIILFAFTVLPPGIELLFGRDYVAAIPYAQALLFTVVIGNHATFRNRFVSSKLDERSMRHILIGISVVRMVSSLALVPFFGIVGAVLSTALYRVASTVIVGRIIRSRYLMD